MMHLTGDTMNSFPYAYVMKQEIDLQPSLSDIIRTMEMSNTLSLSVFFFFYYICIILC